MEKKRSSFSGKKQVLSWRRQVLPWDWEIFGVFDIWQLGMAEEYFFWCM